MAGQRKQAKFKVVDPGTPIVVEVMQGSKRYRVRVASTIFELYDLNVKNPLTHEPIFEVRLSTAFDVKAAVGRK